MRAVEVWSCLALVAACGRVSFDASARPDAEPDAASAPDAPALPASCIALADATPCDDRNACTTRSTCLAQTCMPDVPIETCQLAVSMDDFAAMQGVRGWTYGYYRPADDPDGTYAAADFRASAWLDSAWRPPDYESEFTWAYLLHWGGHPTSDKPTWPLRRWVSVSAGPAEVEVHVGKSDTSCGDGVRSALFVDGVEVWAAAIAFDDRTGVTAIVPVMLEVGTTLDLALQANGGEACDTSDSSAVIRVP